LASFVAVVAVVSFLELKKVGVNFTEVAVFPQLFSILIQIHSREAKDYDCVFDFDRGDK
jgi:hypothetical protein